MCTHPFAKKALTLHLARSEGRERYFGYNLMHCKVLASSHQHLMAEAPNGEKQIGRAYGAPRQPSTLPAQDPPAMAHAIITRLMRVSKVVFFAICCASSASAWDRVGHLVVDAIAWEHMSEPTRERAVEILRAAPRDAGLALSGFGPRELFVRSGYWPDVVRDEAWPVRKEKYDHPTWHYVNHFWREDGTPLPEMGLNGELLERLEALAGTVPDAVELAWLLHLVGDVHQPLHSSARVTNAEPHGDRGGNDFALDDPESWGNLHAFWDSIRYCQIELVTDRMVQ